MSDEFKLYFSSLSTKILAIEIAKYCPCNTLEISNYLLFIFVDAKFEESSKEMIKIWRVLNCV